MPVELAAGPALVVDDAVGEWPEWCSPLDDEDATAEVWDQESDQAALPDVEVSIIYTDTPGWDLHWEIVQRSGGLDSVDNFTRVLAARDLDKIARALANEQGAALRAPSVAEAFRQLTAATQSTLLAKTQITTATDGSFISRRRTLMIHAAAGPLPLGFFAWKREGQRGSVVAEWLETYWNRCHRAGGDDQDALVSEREIAEESANTLYKYRGLMRDLRAQWPTVLAHQRRWPFVTSAELVAALGWLAPAKEGAKGKALRPIPGSQLLSRMALVGVLEPPTDGQADPAARTGRR